MQTSPFPLALTSMHPQTSASADHQTIQAEKSEAVSNSLPSQFLLRGQKTVQIVHHDQVYVLQATRQGKLILTK